MRFLEEQHSLAERVWKLQGEINLPELRAVSAVAVNEMLKVEDKVFKEFDLVPFGPWFLWLLEPVFERVATPFRMMGMSDEEIKRVVSKGSIVSLGLISQAVKDMKEAEQYGKELIGYSPYRL